MRASRLSPSQTRTGQATCAHADGATTTETNAGGQARFWRSHLERPARDAGHQTRALPPSTRRLAGRLSALVTYLVPLLVPAGEGAKVFLLPVVWRHMDGRLDQRQHSEAIIWGTSCCSSPQRIGLLCVHASLLSRPCFVPSRTVTAPLELP